MAKLFGQLKVTDEGTLRQRERSVGSENQITVLFRHRNAWEYEIIFDEFGIRVWEYGAGRYMLETGTEEREKWNAEENERISKKYTQGT